MSNSGPQLPSQITLQCGDHCKTYRLTVFVVWDRKDDGTPNMCRRIADDESVALEGGEEFFTAYLPVEVIR